VLAPFVELGVGVSPRFQHPSVVDAGTVPLTGRFLRPGRSRAAAELVRDFLGRPFGFASWQRWVEAGPRAEM
jgi:hypothetical protein